MSDKVPLFNPLNEDFTVQYDIDGNFKPKSYTIHGKEVEYFDPSIAKHITQALIDRILHLRGIKKNAELDSKEIREEIEVNNG